jgi:subfamily B ATP-binding cassette protein MsbA
MQEAFTGQRVLKAYNLEAEFSRRFLGVSSNIVNQLMKSVRGNEIPSVLVEFSAAIGVSLVFLFVLRNNRAGVVMTSGDFFSFIGSIFLLYQPIKNLSRFYGQIQQARAASDRVSEILGTPPDIADPAQPRPVVAAGSSVEFDRVSFSYGDRLAVSDVSLTIPPGHMVALVGASGSGKTTLTSLLLRFYDPQQGSIRIGGIDLREVRVHELREQMAVVTQETILFNDTLRANIRLGRPAATDAEVEAAAKAAQAHDFILAKPGGYDFMIGERGGSLSGGQRQRLAIARAILRNAPILVLDEATSALDTESERAVQLALDTLMKGRTTLCIAHRLSTIQHADLIVVMDQGRIVEQGHHDELLARNGLYARLHALQFRSVPEASESVPA